MFKNLFKFIDQPLAKVISNVKVRVSLYFVGLTLLIWFLNIIDFWSTMFGLEDYRSLEKFKDPITVLIQSAVFAATVLLFVVGAGGVLTDSVPLSSAAEGEISKVRLELDQLVAQLRGSVDPELVGKKVQSAVDEISKKLELLPKQSVDLSDPDKVFRAARQRLMDDSQRIDRISRRNLYFGIVFSAFALGALAWPLITQSLSVNIGEVGTDPKDVFRWLAQTYLPRFAVAILLQFVGFFFLRLYVANEVDLKHNRNELTNLEVKMMALQLAISFGDASSKKEIVRVLSKTERNFVLKRNEKIISADNSTEYNDMKAVLEQVLRKIPTIKAS
jgi:hypothetical protein